MIYSEYIEAITENLKIKRKQASKYATTLIDIIRKTIETEEVDISRFGKFSKDKETGSIKFIPDDNLYREINVK